MMTCYGDDSFQDDELVGVVAGVRKYMALLLCFCGLESGISCGFGYILQSCCCNKNYYAFEPSAHLSIFYSLAKETTET